MADRQQFQDAYEEAKTLFLQKKPKQMAELAGAIWEPPYLRLPYLNQVITVDHESGGIFPELSLEEHIIIYQYLTGSCGFDYAADKWISFLELPEGQHHYQPFVKEAAEPLAIKFGDDLSGFKNAGIKMGGEPALFGDAAITIKVLPKINLMFIIREGDDEFPAQCSVLFDAGVSYHLPTATLYVLGIIIARKLKEEL